MTPDAARVGEALRRARLARQMSLHSVARKAGISAATLSRVETNKQNIDVALLFSLARILDVPVADVLGENGNGSTEEPLVKLVSRLAPADRARLLFAAAKGTRRGERRDEQLAARMEDLLSTLDVLREELRTLQAVTQRRRRSRR